MQTQSSESALLGMREAGKFLGLSYWRVYGLVKEGVLPVVEVGGKFYLRRTTLMRWLEKSESKRRGVAA